MKLTLLEICQMILSDADSDEINNIGDTPEAIQVANIVKETYIDIISRSNMPKNYTLFELEASGNPDQPVVMYLPDNVLEVKWIKYNKYDPTTSSSNPFFSPIELWDVESFASCMHSHDSDNDNIGTAEITTLNGDTVTILYENDRHPSKYTILEDRILLFDAYLATVDTTLQKSKTACYGEVEPEFVMADNYTPAINSKQFSLLLQEAKSQYFVDLKSTQNPKSEERARRGWLNLQRKKGSFPDNYYDALPNYSRK